MRVIVLGAGFAGLELATRLSDGFGGDVDVLLIDGSDGFVFGFSKLDVMFGRLDTPSAHHPYSDLTKPGVRFVRATVTAIDPAAKRVETTAGTFDGDILVVCLGADLDPAATPGLLESGHDFYTEQGAFALRDVLAAFEGGRVVVAVASTPFKCPPAPSETVLLLHDFLASRGIRDSSEIALVMPLPLPIPPSPAASTALLAAFEERGIEWHPSRTVRSLDSARRLAVLDDGGEMPYDLFLGVPVHRAPEVVVEAGLTVDGWIPVDPLTLETSFPDVYAVGDVTSIGTAKAGVFSEGQAVVVAERIIARARGENEAAEYGGAGICYVEFGQGEVAKVDVTFLSGQPPTGIFEDPSSRFAAEKAEFGASRVRRWFGRDWADAQP